MPVGTRVRGNNAFGVTTDNPLLIGATTLNSTQLSLLPAVSGGGHAIITLDPLRINGNPEIIIVTAHTAGASSATITRGAYGTSARQHPVNTTWVHAPLNEDFVSIVTSGTRPSNPYTGQFIYETDTKKLLGYGGTDWAQREAGGQLGYVENRVVADQNITAGALLTGISIALTLPTGRRIKATCKTNNYSDTVDCSAWFEIRFDGVALDRVFIARLEGSSERVVMWSSIHSPTAGAHTYTVFGQRNGGAGNVLNRAQATQPVWLLVEDIGAV